MGARVPNKLFGNFQEIFGDIYRQYINKAEMPHGRSRKHPVISYDYRLLENKIRRSYAET